MSINTHIMTAAWDISKTAQAFFGGNARDFIAKSLELIHAGMNNAFTPQTTAHEVKFAMVINNQDNFIKSLINKGGQEWNNHGHRRVYFNIDVQCELLGLEIKKYKTGDISQAWLNGEEISNSRAKKIISSLDKFWYNIITGNFEWSRTMHRGFANDLIKVLESK